MKKKFAKNKGITLIALILTIIIMLILVAVTVSIVINSGLLDTTKKAVNDYKTSWDKESRLGENITIGDRTYNSIEEYKQIVLGQEGNIPTITPTPTPASVIAGQKATARSFYDDGEATYPAQIPAGFTVSGNEDEDEISEGLVIYYINNLTDEQIANINWTNLTASNGTINLKETYDQFVWIPIDDADDMFMCQGSTASGSCDLDINGAGQPYCKNHTGENSTKMAGRLYCDEDEWEFDPDPSASIGTYINEGWLREPDKCTSTNTSYVDPEIENTLAGNLQTEYNAMVKSVIENKGFWVGRYETSQMDGENSIKVVAGTTDGISDVTWYIMYDKQKAYATNFGLTGGMISGAAYDQVMIFVHDETNYDVTEAENVDHDFEEPYNTGSQSGDQSKNIFDLEGNVCECTTEVGSEVGRVMRGGGYDDEDTASCRHDGGPKRNADYKGSRISLYL